MRLPALLWLGLLVICAPFAAGNSAEPDSSLAALNIPQPPRPANATACVEPTDIMRREHMNFLLHQRDATVIDGERNSKYSLVGCMDCHNPSDSAETAIRYPEPEHFCAGCHLYTSVRIDCFECHADRGLAELNQSRLGAAYGEGLQSLQTFHRQREKLGEQ